MTYNPYELVAVLVNGKHQYARPCQYDSEVADQQTGKNIRGMFVKPQRLAATCPDCGSGLDLNVALPDPPFDVLSFECQYCSAGPPSLPDPFLDPLAHIKPYELDALLVAPTRETTTVAERLGEVLSPSCNIADLVTEQEESLADLLGHLPKFDDSDLVDE